MVDPKHQQNRLLAPGLRAELRDEQIERIKTEVREAFAERLRAAGTRKEKRVISNEIEAEIDRRTEALRGETKHDTPDCL